MSDWDRSNRFYREVLGAEPVELGKGRWAYRFGNQQPNLPSRGSTPAPFARIRIAPGDSDLCFRWDGTAAPAAAISARATSRWWRGRSCGAAPAEPGRASTSVIRTARCSS